MRSPVFSATALLLVLAACLGDPSSPEPMPAAGPAPEAAFASKHLAPGGLRRFSRSLA